MLPIAWGVFGPHPDESLPRCLLAPHTSRKRQIRSAPLARTGSYIWHDHRIHYTSFARPVQVTDPGHQRRLRGLLDLGMDDGTSSWWLNPDGYWTRHSRDESGHPQRDIQETLVRERRVRSADEPGLPVGW